MHLKTTVCNPKNKHHTVHYDYWSGNSCLLTEDNYAGSDNENQTPHIYTKFSFKSNLKWTKKWNGNSEICATCYIWSPTSPLSYYFPTVWVNKKCWRWVESSHSYLKKKKKTVIHVCLQKLLLGQWVEQTKWTFSKVNPLKWSGVLTCDEREVHRRD